MLVSKSFECSFSNQNVFEHILINLLHLKYCIFFLLLRKTEMLVLRISFLIWSKKKQQKKKTLWKKNLFFFSKKLQQKLSTRQINKFDYSLQKKKVAAAEFGFQHFCRHFCFIADNLYARKKNDTTKITMYTVCFIPLMFFFSENKFSLFFGHAIPWSEDEQSFYYEQKKKETKLTLFFFFALSALQFKQFFFLFVCGCARISLRLFAPHCVAFEFECARIVAGVCGRERMYE